MACLAVVNYAGATAYHGLKKNHRFNPKPLSFLEKIVYFATRFPGRVRD